MPIILNKKELIYKLELLTLRNEILVMYHSLGE